ncbi:hypothetical protein [Kitasatospora sp. Ki12]
MKTAKIVVAKSAAEKLKRLPRLKARRVVETLSHDVDLIALGEKFPGRGSVKVKGTGYSAVDTDAGIALIRPMSQSERVRFNVASPHGYVVTDVLAVEDVKASDATSIERALPKATGASA